MQDGRNIYVIMKTMCPLGYHYNGLMAVNALGHLIYYAHLAFVRFEQPACRGSLMTTYITLLA